LAEENRSAPPAAVSAPTLRAVFSSVARHRGVQGAVGLWIAGFIAVLWLAQGSLPFARPAVAGLPFLVQVAAPNLVMLEIILLMIVTFLLTRARSIPDMAARAPDRRRTLNETSFILGYAALGQIGGWLAGPALGFHPFSFHIAGSIYGCLVAPGRAEVWTWALYNFVVFAVIPYVYFRRHYTNAELNLRSTNLRNDVLVVVVILFAESGFELLGFDNNVFRLPLRQVLLGAPLTFAIFFIGTVLPTMVLIYAILLPRFLKLTGSATSTVLLGGLTYAGMHLVEGWSAFDSPRHVALSLIFVVFQYFGPGMMKSVLTLRTGNAWVHAVSYHALAPHVLVDTPLIVKIFAIR
jgi:hypothetical protein